MAKFEILTKVGERIEDPFPGCDEKKDFEKHLEAYHRKLMRCNICWDILGCIADDRQGYYTAASKSPCFWNTAIYSIKMSLVTDIVSFVSNDKESLANYLRRVQERKDRIFPQRFFDILMSENTKEEKEEDVTPKGSIDAVLRLCSIKIACCKRNINVLKKARDKILCHFDSLAIAPPEEQQKEVIETLTDEIVEGELRTIGEILNLLEVHYRNSKTVLKYIDSDDVKNTFSIMKRNADIKFF